MHRHMAQCVTHLAEVILLDLLEIKCPFSHHNMTPKQACLDRHFCCTVQENADRTKRVVLKRDHLYFAQVQGRMVLGERPWCDFVIYTTQGLRIHRVLFDSDYWEESLLYKLVSYVMASQCGSSRAR